ncbi:DUF4352 domain-containing protein [Planobispora longispora]|uniref:DUF4352 domain-containing protein n=1 Tax=Planobispora longispora TaxID=28887 RepID=A0A8J3RG30_9ACTN|nr:DUF4352 domain-containing protein [Planobispora longispora]BFE89041.1 hypothetical protein GCM10020093_116420 [Planobispora longispora]GIH74070.1 hypothetical protein Plo01_04990 [Planobispora longispora]
MSRLAASAGTALLLAATLGACSGGAADPEPTATPTPLYDLAPRHVRDFEVPVTAAPVTVGKLKITAIGLRTGFCCVVGTHAEWPAKGQYVFVRVQLHNTDRDRQKFEGLEQLLITQDGRSHKVDITAMNIRRQDYRLTLGAGNILETDLIYDVPKDAKVKAIRFTAKVTTAIGGINVETQQKEVPLPPTSR